MKNIIKKNNIVDAIACAKKSKDWDKYSGEARVKNNLAIAIYQRRAELGMSQQELAKRAYTSQKVISNIESGEVNVGLGLYNRIIEVLNLGSVLHEIHNCGLSIMLSPLIKVGIKIKSGGERMNKLDDSKTKIGQKIIYT